MLSRRAQIDASGEVKKLTSDKMVKLANGKTNRGDRGNRMANPTGPEICIGGK